MKLLLVVLVTAGVLQEPKPQTAEEALKEIEKKYLSATTVKWKQTIKYDNGEEDPVTHLEENFTVDVAIKKGNRVRVIHKGREGQSRILSDGRKLLFDRPTYPMVPPPPTVPGKDLDAYLRLIFVRAGYRSASFHQAIRQIEDADKVAKTHVVSEVKWGPRETIDGKDLRTIEYSLLVIQSGLRDTYKVKLAIDWVNCVMRRRVTEFPLGRETEDYTDTQFDSTLEDDLFKVPEAPKKED